MCRPGCLDTLTIAQQLKLEVLEEAKEKTAQAKVYTKEDYSVVNRFESQWPLAFKKKKNAFLHLTVFNSSVTWAATFCLRGYKCMLVIFMFP